MEDICGCLNSTEFLYDGSTLLWNLGKNELAGEEIIINLNATPKSTKKKSRGNIAPSN